MSVGSFWQRALLCLLLCLQLSRMHSTETSPQMYACPAWDQATAPGQSLEKTDAFIFEQVLAENFHELDPMVPKCIEALKERGAHRCWHKHSTFLDHLVGVYKLLRLWGQGQIIGRVGLFHSAYSNSYVNLALFDPETERDHMRGLIGEEAEELVYLFCIIDRQAVVVDTLLKQGFIPRDGLSVPHLRDPSAQVFLSAETLRMLVVFSMADTSDQYFGWQDALFGGGGGKGSMIIPGHDFADRHDATAIWPGLSKPGLWMNYISRLGRAARSFEPDAANVVVDEAADDRHQDVPPIFARGTAIISVEDEASAINLYWRVISDEVSDADEVVSVLRECSEKNPWVFEPLVLLAQKHLHRNDFDGAKTTARLALILQQQWGTPWDKRMSFNAWVAWTRVLYQRAEDGNPWPTNSWEVNNLGLVR